MFETDALAPFTIIGGKNNTGKTSLLEAIFYLAHRSFGAVPGQLMVNRRMSLRKRDLSPLFYNLNADTLQIDSVFSDGSKRGLTLEVSERSVVAVQLERPEKLEDVRNAASPFFEQQWYTTFSNGEEARGISEVFFTNDEYKVREIEFKSKTADGDKLAPKDTWKCYYYQTRSVGNMKPVYKEVFKRKKDDILVKALHPMDKRVIGVTFDGDQVLVDIGLKEARIPIEVMGDGFVKATDVIALAALAKQGDIICIDEIENGLHHSFMGTFIGALAELVEERGVQIVATTHNLELMQSAAEQDAHGFRDKFAYINLARESGGDIVATIFNHDEFAANIESGIDLR